jgi:hypothetical protein
LSPEAVVISVPGVGVGVVAVAPTEDPLEADVPPVAPLVVDCEPAGLEAESPDWLSWQPAIATRAAIVSRRRQGVMVSSSRWG